MEGRGGGEGAQPPHSALTVDPQLRPIPQGFPNFPSPAFVKQAAMDAVAGDHNQARARWQGACVGELAVALPALQASRAGGCDGMPAVLKPAHGSHWLPGFLCFAVLPKCGAPVPGCRTRRRVQCRHGVHAPPGPPSRNRGHCWRHPGDCVAPCLTVSHGVSRCLTVSHGVSRCLTVSHGVSRCLTGVSRCLTVCMRKT